MKILSFDCGYVTLSSTLMSFEINDLLEISSLIKYIDDATRVLHCKGSKLTATDYKKVCDKTIFCCNEVNRLYSIIFKPLECRLYDVSEGKKIVDLTSEERACGIRTALSIQDTICLPSTLDYVIIEHQFSKNTNSREVQMMISYHYAHCVKIKVSPSIEEKSIQNISKGISENIKYPKIRIVDPKLKAKCCFGKGLEYDNYSSRYQQLYTANKIHAKENFIHYATISNYILEGISIKVLHNVADSWLLGIVFILNEFISLSINSTI
jgi:hypothetical protein